MSLSLDLAADVAMSTITFPLILLLLTTMGMSCDPCVYVCQSACDRLQRLNSRLECANAATTHTRLCRKYLRQMVEHSCLLAQDGCQVMQILQPGSGVRQINVTGIQFPVSAYCDQDTNNGGWTVIQRRQDGSVNFNRTWADYQVGFGNPAGEYWLGLETVYRMTSTKRYEIRFDLQLYNGTTGFIVNNDFSVGPSFDFYRLSMGPKTAGNLGDYLSYYKGIKFSTVDKDNDDTINNCAVMIGGGWWYAYCSLVNLNSPYSQNSTCPNHNYEACPSWLYFGPPFENSLQYIAIKIRPMQW